MNTTEKIEAAYKAIAEIAKKASDEQSFTVELNDRHTILSVRPNTLRRRQALSYRPLQDFYHGAEVGAICQQFGLSMVTAAQLNFECEPYFAINIFVKK